MGWLGSAALASIRWTTYLAFMVATGLAFISGYFNNELPTGVCVVVVW